MTCFWPQCRDNTAGRCSGPCSAVVYTPPFSIPSPRTLPLVVPLPSYGRVTIAMVDEDGNVDIRVDQPKPTPLSTEG